MQLRTRQRCLTALPPPPRSKCRKVGPKTADKAKLAWEAAHGNTALAAAADAARSSSPYGGSPGLTMAQLLEAPPAVGFPWGPATRCYSAHLHAAEQVVAQRSLQRAAAYKQPGTRQLNKIRKWLAANQSATGGLRAGLDACGRAAWLRKHPPADWRADSCSHMRPHIAP